MPSFPGITHISLEISSRRVFYGVESWSGVFELSIGVEWVQILQWQKFLLFAHKMESKFSVQEMSIFFKTVKKLSKMKLSGLWVSLFILFHTLSFILVV